MRRLVKIPPPVRLKAPRKKRGTFLLLLRTLQGRSGVSQICRRPKVGPKKSPLRVSVVLIRRPRQKFGGGFTLFRVGGVGRRIRVTVSRDLRLLIRPIWWRSVFRVTRVSLLVILMWGRPLGLLLKRRANNLVVLRPSVILRVKFIVSPRQVGVNVLTLLFLGRTKGLMFVIPKNVRGSGRAVYDSSCSFTY